MSRIFFILIINVIVLIVLDVSSAQVCKYFNCWEKKPSQEEKKYRIRSPMYHHDLAKNIHLEATWGPISYPYRTNSLGFRDAISREISKKSLSKRILFIGDSFTEGVGVRYEKTFVGILSDYYRKFNIEILNAGVTSYSPSIYYKKIEYLINDLDFHFDCLVVFLDISDIYDEAISYRVKDGVVVDANLGLWEWKGILKNNSHLIRLADLIKDRTFERREEELALNDFRSMWTIDEARFKSYGLEGLDRAGKYMDKLHRILKKHEIGLIIGIYPWPDQIINNDLNSRQVFFWKNWARERSILLINLFPIFIDNKNSEETIRRYFIPSDLHWNEHGHRLVAQEILERLKSDDHACN